MWLSFKRGRNSKSIFNDYSIDVHSIVFGLPDNITSTYDGTYVNIEYTVGDDAIVTDLWTSIEIISGVNATVMNNSLTIVDQVTQETPDYVVLDPSGIVTIETEDEEYVGEHILVLTFLMGNDTLAPS